MKTGLLIKELRIKKGLTQQELAEQTELSARTIQRIENGDVDARAYSLQMIAKALDVDYALFIEDEAIPENEKINTDFVLGFLHLSGMLLLIIPSYLIWKNHKHNIENITMHFKASVGFQLTAWLFILIGIFQYYMVGMPYAFYGAALFTVYFSIINAINVFNNKAYKYLNLFKLKNTQNQG